MTVQDLNLEGKVAIVTGSTSGIGLAIAVKLAECRVQVFINGRDNNILKDAIDKLGDKGLNIHGFTGDVSDQGFVKDFVAKVLKKAGHIDILVNNAGVSGIQRLEEIKEDLWDYYMNCNLKSAFLMSKESSPFMMKQKSGKIINIASTVTRSGMGGAHYVAAKSGVIGLTRALARELGPFNIQVNAVAPGLTDTDAARRNYGKRIFDQVARYSSLGRVASPNDIAKAVLFFSSPLSDFITGQILEVSGGAVFP